MNQDISVTEIFRLMNEETWDFDRDEPKTYGLKYVNSKGEMNTRYNCRKNVKTIHQLKQRVESTHSTRPNYDRAIKGLVHIYDHDTDEHREIMASQILYFRNHGSKTWNPIKN